MRLKPDWTFLIDENADFRLKRNLRTAGFTATHIRATDVGLGSFPDSAVFAYAKAYQLILLTIDQDFLNTALSAASFYPSSLHQRDRSAKKDHKKTLSSGCISRML